MSINFGPWITSGLSFLTVCAGLWFLTRAMILSRRDEREVEKHKCTIRMMKADVERMEAAKDGGEA